MPLRRDGPSRFREHFPLLRQLHFHARLCDKPGEQPGGDRYEARQQNRMRSLDDLREAIVQGAAKRLRP